MIILARTVYAVDGSHKTIHAAAGTIRIAIAGNPNSGKTTAFNDLTGSVQYVGNWPGVTIEKKEGKFRGKKDVILVDLPGIYSLSPYTLEEVVSRDFIINERPNAIIDIVDASNLERNLYLATQLIETGLPVVVVLNMMDIVEKSGDTIDMDRLSEELGCPVMGASALKGRGLTEAVEKALELAHTIHHAEHHHDAPDHDFSEHIHHDVVEDELKYEHGSDHPENPLETSVGALSTRPVSMCFEDRVEQALSAIMPYVEHLAAQRLMTPRWLAVKFFERDPRVLAQFTLPAAESEAINAVIDACEKDYSDSGDAIIIDQRYNYIETFVNAVLVKKSNDLHTFSDRVDKIVTNPILAFPIFFVIMWGIYYLAMQSLGDAAIGWVEVITEVVGGGVEGFLEGIGAADWIIGLVVEGFIGGVGAVLTFVPQMCILFFFIALLEDCGYMSRVAFIMDRLFRRFGLSGKSIIPMVIGTGCSVPGIMASRTIETERERRLTIMLTPCIPCGAKLPVFALFIAAFFPDNTWVGPSMYFLGIAMVVLSGLMLKNTKWFKGDGSPFIMELPPYRVPNARNVALSVWERASSFIIKAGTVILVVSGLIWILSNFNFGFQMVDDATESMLAAIGHTIAPIFAPLGFGTWQAAVATFTGFLAKEAVVSTMGVLYGVGEVMEDDPTLIAYIGNIFTPASAYAFMVFTLLAAPCAAAIGAIRREMNNWKWTLAAVGYQTGLAYVMAFLVYQIGNIIL